MAPTTSFAPLAARLAARADEIRPVDGAEVSWANFMALFVCSILEMLIALCEALDARAAADARLVMAPATRDSVASVVPAARAGCRALPAAVRPPRLTLAPEVQAIIPKPDEAGSGTAEPRPDVQWRGWSPHPGRDWAVRGLPWRPRRETRALHHGVHHACIVNLSK